jgi:phosphoribosylglycinamide formyltransferase-1
LKKKRIAILISGRGSNMEAIVRQAQGGILQDCCEVVLALSNKAGAKGLESAAYLGIPVVCIESKGKTREAFDQEVVDYLKPFNLDYIILAGFMRILSPALIRNYRNRIINIHPADTREFQGVGAYEWAFRNRKSSTMITVHFVDEGVDTGQVIAREEVDLRGADTLEEVEYRGLAVEHRFYSQVLRRVFSTDGD